MPSASGKVWLHMLSEGGRWTVGELTGVAGKDRGHLERILYSMVDHGHVIRYRAGHRKNGAAYGVDHSCRIPRDVPLREILKAVPAEPREEDIPVALRGDYGLGKVSSVWALGN